MELREIKDFEGYLVSDTGLVFGKMRPNQPLKPDISERNQTKYERVTLSKEGVKSRFLVHRLVAQAFIPNPENKPDINHIDNNGQNNHVDNLEWCTHSENMQHCHAQGRCSNLIASEAARKSKHRYAAVYQERMGDRFIAFYPADKVVQTSNKVSSAVKYYCKECNCVRLAKPNWNEIKEHNGTCPNCIQSLKLTDEDIVLSAR